jgi:hypothetical protein
MQNTKQKKHYVRRGAVSVAKGWLYSVGLTSLAESGKRIGGRIGGLGNYVWHEITGKKQYRNETFQEAVQRQGLSTEDLIRRAHLFQRQSFLWLALAMSSAGLQLYYSFHGGLTPTAVLLSCAFELMAIAKTIAYRFNVCRVRDEAFYDFLPWLMAPSRW